MNSTSIMTRFIDHLIANDVRTFTSRELGSWLRSNGINASASELIQSYQPLEGRKARPFHIQRLDPTRASGSVWIYGHTANHVRKLVRQLHADTARGFERRISPSMADVTSRNPQARNAETRSRAAMEQVFEAFAQI